MNDFIVLNKLLKYGLFPEKLEGIFHSESFGSLFYNDLVKNKCKLFFISKSIYGKKTFSPVTYKITRHNNFPRIFSIPHPLSYCNLCKLIYENWTDIEINFVSKDYLQTSFIRPKINKRKDRLTSFDSYEQPPNKKHIILNKQFEKKFIAITDISSFFSSIYTHSIPWALIGKDQAKYEWKNKINQDSWYNKIDIACRVMQDYESKGIPIGPDTSLIISELILSKVDSKLSQFDFVRYVDDYKCYCKTHEEAENFFVKLSCELEKFNLSLNKSKTNIISLPHSIDDYWVEQLRDNADWDLFDTKKNQNRIISYLDRASILFKENPSASAIRYAVRVVINKPFKNDINSFLLIVRYYLNLCYLYPYVIDFCDQFLLIGFKLFHDYSEIIKKMFEESLNKILSEHIKYNRSDVIAWILYISIKHKLELESIEDITNEIISNDDCIPSLLCFLYRKAHSQDNSEFQKLFSSKEDSSEWWLFIYEYGRLMNATFKDRFYEMMRQNNVSFLSSKLDLKFGFH